MAKFVDRSDAAIAALLKSKAPLVEELAGLVRDEIVAVMEEATPTGKSKGGHTRSAPGEPPAEDTGDYIRSWQTTEATIARRRVTASAFTDLMSGDGQTLRGIYLEYGTENMEPRPHISVGRDRVRPTIKQRVRKASRGGK